MVGNVYTANVFVTGNIAESTSNSINSGALSVNNAFMLTSFIASNSTLNPGQVSLITATVSGGTPPYTYNFIAVDTDTNTLSANFLSVNNPSTTNSFVFKPAVIDTYQLDVIVTDSAAMPESVNDPITINVIKGSGSVSILPSNTVLDSGQTETYTIAVVGGTGPFIINLFNITGSSDQGAPFNAIIASPGGGNTISFTAYGTGSFSFNGIATDTGANAFTFNSISSTIIINGNANNINGNVPTVTLTPSGTSLLPGQTETYTITANGGTGPFEVSLFNITGSSQQGYNVVIPVPGGSNTVSFVASNPGTFAYNATVSDMGTKPYAFVFNSVSSQITVAQPATTTTIGGGGGGGGGGIINSGGGFGGGSSKPVISTADGCIIIDNVTVPNSFAFNLSNGSFNVTDNYIANNYTSIIVNGVTYVLYLGVPTPINGTSIYMALTGVSYLPILHTVNMQACVSQSKQVSSISVYANLTNSTFSITNVVPDYLFGSVTLSGSSDAPAPPNGYSGIFLVNFTVNSSEVKTANMTVNYPCSINSSTLSPYLLQNEIWEPVGQFSVNSTACSISFNVPNHSTIALLSKLKVQAQVQPVVVKPSAKKGVIIETYFPPKKGFPWTAAVLGLGLAAVSTTKLRKKLPRSRQPEHRQGNSNKVIRLIERLAIIEILIFAAMLLLFPFHHNLLSMIVAFGFGIVLAYFVDRIIAARRPDSVYAYKRRAGIMRLVEEVGIIEMVLFVATAWAYVAKQAIPAVVLAFLLGLALSYFIDRIRQVRKMERDDKQNMGTVSSESVTPAAGAAASITNLTIKVEDTPISTAPTDVEQTGTISAEAASS